MALDSRPLGVRAVVLTAVLVWAPCCAPGLPAVHGQEPGSSKGREPLFSRPTGAQGLELEVLDDGALSVATGPDSPACPETLFEDTPVLRREEQSQTFGGPSGARTIQFVFHRCVYGPDGRGRLQVYVTRSEPDHATTWRLFGSDTLGDEIVAVGFAGFPDADDNRHEQRLPAVSEVPHAPGLFTLAFLRKHVSNRYAWVLEEWLIDLRPEIPRVVARVWWWNYAGWTSGSTEEDFSCSWFSSKGDFQCEEREGRLARRFWLLSGEAIDASLESTEPLETAVPGSLVYVPGIGRSRLVASLGPATRLVGPPFELVERSTTGWRRPKNFDPRPKLGWLEATDAPSLRVREFPRAGREDLWDRMWEVESGDEHYLVATPGPHSLRIGIRMDIDPLNFVGLEDEVLALHPRGDSFEVLVQPPARIGGDLQLSFDVDGEGDSHKACAYTADLRFDRRDGFGLTRRPEQRACDRPVLPLIPRPRFGRMDVLFGDGMATGGWAFSVRGVGPVTTVLLDGGLADAWWGELALSLPNGTEVLRVNEGDLVDSVPAALDAVSADQWALVSFGATAAAAPSLLGSLPRAPLTIVLVEPRGIDPGLLGWLSQRTRVVSRDPEELRRWRDAGAIATPLTTDTRSAVEQAVRTAGSQ